jgi:DNA-binding MarR family transcriptional regulator
MKKPAAQNMKPGFQRMPGILIRRALQYHNTIFSEETQGRDITAPQFGALRALFEFPGIDQATLAKFLALDRATVGGLVDRLELKGLVRRTLDPDDRRARVLHLTPRGRVLLSALRPKVARVSERMLASLTREERQFFLDILERMVDGETTLERDEDGLLVAT